MPELGRKRKQAERRNDAALVKLFVILIIIVLVIRLVGVLIMIGLLSTPFIGLWRLIKGYRENNDRLAKEGLAIAIIGCLIWMGILISMLLTS